MSLGGWLCNTESIQQSVWDGMIGRRAAAAIKRGSSTPRSFSPEPSHPQQRIFSCCHTSWMGLGCWPDREESQEAQGPFTLSCPSSMEWTSHLYSFEPFWPLPQAELSPQSPEIRKHYWTNCPWQLRHGFTHQGQDQGTQTPSNPFWIPKAQACK